MLTKFLLWALFLFVVFWKIGGFFRNIARAASGRPSPGTPGNRGRAASPAPPKGEVMARDPVCGTFVVRARALSARGASGEVYFCSDTCRQTYLTR